MNDDGEVLARFLGLRVKESGRAIRSVALHGLPNGIHIVDAGETEQQLHSGTGDADEQNGHQGDAPLHGELFRGASPPIR